MKRFLFIGLAVLLAACAEEYKSPWPDALQLLSVNAVYPDGYAHAVHEGAVIRIEEISSGAAYLARTDRRGLAEIEVPPGIYRITCSDRTGKDLFNGAADKVVVTERRIVDLRLSHSTAGGLVIKEIYTGGCSKAPQEGTYQSDQYFIIHNNDFETVYLDSLCFGTLSATRSRGRPFSRISPRSRPWSGSCPGAGRISRWLPAPMPSWPSAERLTTRSSTRCR